MYFATDCFAVRLVRQWYNTSVGGMTRKTWRQAFVGWRNILAILKKINYYPPSNDGFFLVLGRGVYCYRLLRQNFLLWRHFASISDLEFKVVLVSAKAIIVFSQRHKSHLFEPFLYVKARALMDQSISNFLPSLFNFQTYFDNSDFPSCFWCLNEFECS